MRANRRPDEEGSAGLPLLLRATQAARRLGISRSEFYRWQSMGVLPEPVRFGRRMLWSCAGLDAWAAQNCPARGQERQR